MDRKILNIVNRVLGGKNSNRRLFESKKEMCSECGSGGMYEGECNECGYMKENKGMCSECGGRMMEGKCSECGHSKESELGERLHGKQYKLDKNKNGRLDREDFKMIRRKTEVKEKLYGRQHVLDKNNNKKIDAEDFKMIRKESVYGIQIDNKTHYFKENEVINIIENIVLEEKKKSKTKTPNVTKSSLEKSKKENDDYIASVVKKMKDYLKDGSKGDYDMMPKDFPKGNGQLEKMKKMAYTPSNTAQEYIDNFTAAGLENLDYDEIHPNDEWVTDNLVGSSRTGNNSEWANAVETNVGEKRNKIRQNNLLAKVKRKAYQKDDQPVKIDSSGEDFGDTVDDLLKKYSSNPKNSKKVTKESTNTKQDNVLNEDLVKMKKLIEYGKKTQ